MRGGDFFVNAARQPVTTYDRTACKYVNAYDVISQQNQNNVASRGFSTTCAKAATGTPDVRLSAADSPIRGAEIARIRATSKRCTSRRTFRIRLVQRKGRKYRSATISVNGKKVRTLTGARLGAGVNLRGLPSGTFRVTIAATLTNGRTLRYTRRYRTCRRKLPPSNRLESQNAV